MSRKHITLILPVSLCCITSAKTAIIISIIIIFKDNFYTCIRFHCKVPENLLASACGNLPYFTCYFECFMSVMRDSSVMTYALCLQWKSLIKKKWYRFGNCLLVLSGHDKKRKFSGYFDSIMLRDIKCTEAWNVWACTLVLYTWGPVNK